MAGAWLLFGFTLHPAWRQRTRWISVLFSVLLILMAVLVIRAPLFGFFSYTGYFFTFFLPGRWRLRRGRRRGRDHRHLAGRRAAQADRGRHRPVLRADRWSTCS